MSSSLSPNMIETMRLLNRRVRELVKGIRDEEGNSAAFGGAPLVAAGNFDGLLGELTRAAAWLKGVPPDSMLDAEWAREISDYRHSLESLQKALPTIYARLLAEKVRLEGSRTHVAAARAWAGVSRETL